ncbi:MAG: FtsX-like permease family protein [Thermofilaceae archaeon]
MKRRNKAPVTVVVLAALLVLCSYLATAAPEELKISLLVVEPDGSPLANATVLILNYRTIRPTLIGNTNASGHFTASVPSGDYYVIYILMFSGDTLTHVPVKVDLTNHPNALALSGTVTLYPAARVIVSGRIVYLGGQPAGSARVIVLSREGDPLSRYLSAGEATVATEKANVTLSPRIVDVYGPADDYVFIRRGLGAEVLRANEAIVPINTPIRLSIQYSVLEVETTMRIVSQSVERGTREDPLIFKRGDVMEIDLLTISLEGQIHRSKQELASAKELIAMYEAMGFYIPELNDALLRSSDYIASAEQAFARGEPPERVLALLEAARAITVFQVPARLSFLRSIATVGATVMPSFLAAFAAILSFYFFDSQRAKMISFLLLYAALVLTFVYVYPGFRLLWALDRSLFLATVAAALVAFTMVIFVLPRVIKEPQLPGEISLSGLIAVAFTLGKRYSKVKALRTFITVFSIAAFIWAFTVLATFGAVYEKIEERGFADYPFNTFVLKKVANGTPLPLNIELDPLLFEGKEGFGTISLTVFNRPDVSLRIAVSRAGREAFLQFAMGVDENELRLNPRLSESIRLVRPFGNDSVILPLTVWNMLGLLGGETLDVTFEAQGFGRQSLRLVASGYFNESSLERVLDPDRAPLRPFVVREGVVSYANASTILITSSRLLTRLLAAEGGYSQVFFAYRIAASNPGEEEGVALASEIIDRRGEGYVAISCYNGKCTRVYYGTRVRSIFEQELTFLVPLLIVVANVLLSMLSIIRERRREIFIFTTVGFNPRHIALVFLAEAIVYGLLSGGFGYVAGLASFRLLSMFAGHLNLMVREKLEWYWSYLAIALAVVVSIVGAIKPSMDAAYMFAPTEVRRIKIAEVRERAKRTEYVTRTAAAKTFSIPGEVKADEGEVAFAYIYSKLADLSYGELEAVRELTDHPAEERPDGTRIKRFTFIYASTTQLGEKAEIDCELRFVLSPSADSYRVELTTKPVGQAPISHMDYAADLVKRIINDWMSERERLLSPV